MSVVRNVITTTLEDQGFHPGRFSTEARVVEAVVTALEAKEAELTAQIRAEANRLRVPQPQVEAFLTRVGLVEPTPEPEVQDTVAAPNGTGFEERMDRLEATVNRLVTAAQRHLPGVQF